jgi:hypothetical protein
VKKSNIHYRITRDSLCAPGQSLLPPDAITAWQCMHMHEAVCGVALLLNLWDILVNPIPSRRSLTPRLKISGIHEGRSKTP